ncbi:hypothetical protein [Streptomyces sp. NPDC057889]|uniref:hypothetical protein n=1 Tax=unclassified Streptomyces TaxID=2593676 RepID=UPI0036AFAC37
MSERRWPPSASREFLDVALRAVTDDEPDGYVALLRSGQQACGVGPVRTGRAAGD